MRWLAAACILILSLAFAMTAHADSIGQGTLHFNITFFNGAGQDNKNATLFQVLEGSYDYVNNYFGTCPRRVEVIVVDNKEMDEAGKQVDSLSAWNEEMSAIILRQDSLKDKSFLPVLVRHEMTHLAINDILSKKDPGEFHWMEEGLCMLVSKEPLSDVNVSSYIVGRGFLNTGEIYSAIKNEDCTISKDGYMQSYSLVKYIAERFGMSALISLLKCPETSLEKAFLQCTGEDFPTFYNEWEDDVSKTASGNT
jgi:hypothetical protein